jgi:hypothetical protein
LLCGGFTALGLKKQRIGFGSVGGCALALSFFVVAVFCASSECCFFGVACGFFFGCERHWAVCGHVVACHDYSLAVLNTVNTDDARCNVPSVVVKSETYSRPNATRVRTPNNKLR